MKRKYNIGDVAWTLFVTFLIVMGLSPLQCSSAQIVNGDVNGNGAISLSDAVYLINYIFNGGNPPKDLYKHIDFSTDLRWQAPPDSDVIGCQVRYDTDSTRLRNSWDSCSIVVSWCGETTWPSYFGKRDGVTITNLDSNITYYFAIKFEDSDSLWSDISNILPVRLNPNN